MKALFDFILAHPTASWTLFLLPLTIIMVRGFVLDQRAERHGLPVSYSPLLALGLVPLVNIPIALAVLWKCSYEFRTGLTQVASW